MMYKNVLVRVSDTNITIFRDISTLRLALSLTDLKDGKYYENVNFWYRHGSDITLDNPSRVMEIHTRRYPTDINKCGTIVSLELSELVFGKCFSLFNWSKDFADLGKSCVTYVEDNTKKTIIKIGDRNIYFKDLL